MIAVASFGREIFHMHNMPMQVWYAQPLQVFAKQLRNTSCNRREIQYDNIILYCQNRPAYWPKRAIQNFKKIKYFNNKPLVTDNYLNICKSERQQQSA